MLPLQVLFAPFPFTILILELPDIAGEKILTAAPSPSHFLMGTQQCLYPSLIASCGGILFFCKTAGLCPPTCTHMLTYYTLIYHAAPRCVVLAHFHLTFTSAFQNLYVFTL